ncbi:MAG: hypothetical protein QF712_03205 [Candidatus Marinimicrobia bacterium]|jgi:HEAT repeat protein|nr:hypothetical protein [Candidatus Neomarinimicrobiota bacterium]|tara:strand:- start:339 stop:1418 length:1080 start_codon:yes stop_codon:yes gene_type:complete
MIKGLFGKKSTGEQTLAGVEELRLSYIQGDISALEELITIYTDEDQPLNVRVSAVRAMGESRHPLALHSLAEYVGAAEALELDLMTASIDVLGGFEDDPIASEALMESIFSIDEKLRELQGTVFKSLTNVSSEDQVLALIDVYERSRAAFYNTSIMISKTLAEMDEDEVVPILIFLAQDETLDVKTRNRALEILSKRKDDPKVVEMFVEMLTNPSLETQVRDFALHTMKGVKEERLILALLETFNQGQASYYSLLNTLLDALGKFDDPTVKPTLAEIALSDNIPKDLRVKAIKNLGNFRDPLIFKKVLPMLEDPESYFYYPYIIELAFTLGVAEEYKNEIKEAALVAQEKALEEEKREE